MPPAATDLRTVASPDDIRLAVHTFHETASEHPDRAGSLARQTTYWVTDPDTGGFGPSKFVGYAGMTLPRYDDAVARQVAGDRFDGTVARMAFERALGHGFEADAHLAEALTVWVEDRLGPGIFEGVDRSKWRFVRLPARRRYWAFAASPKVYALDEAIAELEQDLWTVNRGDVHAGDRVVLWRTADASGRRGVVALAEVLSEPAELPLPRALWGYWRALTDEAMGPLRRVWVRYVVPAGVPRWLDEGADGVVADLSVSRATGGSVFQVQPDQWDRLARALGGWPSTALAEAGLPAAETARDEGPTRARGQGFQVSPLLRRALEDLGMARARAHFEALKYDVEDKHLTRPFDFLCTRGDETLYVEVKATTTAGEGVLLTPNEVHFARLHRGQMVLALLHSVRVIEDASGVIVDGGELVVLEPWDVDAGELTPVTFTWRRPPAP